jgi:hypothetical protein
MIIATPLNIYNQEVATKLLSPFPKSETNGAIILLNDEKVIHKQSAADTARFFGFTSA